MYILQISSQAFIQIKENSIEISSDYSIATKFETIGKAMKKASKINAMFNNYSVKILKL